MKAKNIIAISLMSIGSIMLIYGGFKAYHYYRDVDKSDKTSRQLNFQKEI